MENKLPQGWVLCPLKDVVSSRKGKKPATVINHEKKGYDPYLLIDELEGKPARAFTNDPKVPRSNKKDVLLVWDGSIGKCASGIPGAVGSTIAVLSPKKGLNTKFLEYFIRRSKNYILETSTGTGLQHINKSLLKTLEIPLPSEEDQERIADKLDILLAKVKDAQSRLDKIPLILSRFRQSILAAAFSGCLTADWREKNQSFEDIDTMLEAIKKRRDGKAKTAAQKNKLREIFLSSEEGDSSELPESWRYVFLNKLCDSFDYGTSAKSKPSGKVPVLRMGNIQNGKIDWMDLVYTSDEEEIKSYCLQPNTVLFNRTNSPELVGKTAIYRGERPAIFAGYLIRVNQCPKLDPEYLNLCLNTIYAKEFCHRVKTDGVSQSNINAQKLGTFEIPFCSFAEQCEIVRRVKSLFKLADEIEARYTKAKAQVDKLAQSILAKAFRGELVLQDRNDEPASVLLEKIKTYL